MSKDRVTLHPEKLKLLSLINYASKLDRSNLSWTLNNIIIHPSKETTHLGIIRSEQKKLNIDARLSIERRTLYSLIKTGGHRSNRSPTKSKI